MRNLYAFCPNISSLKFECHDRWNYHSEISWFSGITGFHNLEKLEMDIYFREIRRYRTDEYITYQEMVQGFLDNPMTKMKEIKMNTISALFQDEFVGHITDIFPNLQTFNLAELGDQGNSGYSFLQDKSKDPDKLPHWRYDTILQVLRSLGSIKTLMLPTMELVLSSWNDKDEHYQSIRETGHVFNEALQIIRNQFPLSLGDLKITDEKYGYVILKEKMKKPKMFNQMTANDRPVREIVHFGHTKKVHLKLKPKRKQKRLKDKHKNDEEEIVLSEELIKTLYKKYVDNSK